MAVSMDSFEKAFSPITEEDLKKCKEKLDEIGPVAVKMETRPYGYLLLSSHLRAISQFKEEELSKRERLGLPTLKGVKIEVTTLVESDLKDHQAKIIYSDGSAKTIDLCREDEVCNKLYILTIL